ncbi:HAD-like domain-containing protein [Mycena belliarum]|uniref:HAD-like domain-containing protein n=1 Tax=Mycena belliarum TaxID=1033014 RepID=A0AAD6XMR0_9AGAR|nr:HAD-like domain-containing protein [Mycena belliae]
MHSSKPAPPGTRPSHPFAFEDSNVLQSTAKAIGVDEARIRKFAEEQARLDRAHSPATPVGDPAIRKFAEEQARLHRAHSPEIPRNDTHAKFAEEQARLQRAHSPELPRSEAQSKFAEEQARLNRAHSPDTSRNESRPRAVHTPTGSPEDSARLAEMQSREQEIRARMRLRVESQQVDTRNGSGSRLGHNSQTQTQTQTQRGKTSSPTTYVPTLGRRAAGAAPSLFSRFPLNEPDEARYRFDDDSSLTKVEVLFFELDGTVLDWRGTVAAELQRQGSKYYPQILKAQWEEFATKWRDMYLTTLRSLAQQGDSLAPSVVYRNTLDQLLNKEVQYLRDRWTPTIRNEIVGIWERLQAWPDTKERLKSLRTIKTIATLSNLPLRAQTQMSRHAGLSWDACLSASLLGCFKPNPDAYLEAARSMSLPPANCALVSARAEDLRIAGSAGMRTIYVRRASEDLDVEGDIVSKLEGGEFDLVVESFEHLAIILGCD